MTKHLIHFEKMPWEKPAPGVQQKTYSNGKNRMRLLIFQDNFVEADWCAKGHVGYVLEGKMKIDFNGNIKSYQKGDGLWIEQGESSQHKVIMEKGTQVKLILFEVEK